MKSPYRHTKKAIADTKRQIKQLPFVDDLPEFSSVKQSVNECSKLLVERLWRLERRLKEFDQQAIVQHPRGNGKKLAQQLVAYLHESLK